MQIQQPQHQINQIIQLKSQQHNLLNYLQPQQYIEALEPQHHIILFLGQMDNLHLHSEQMHQHQALIYMYLLHKEYYCHLQYK